MKAVMLGYWVIFFGVVLQALGLLWDAVDDLVGEEAVGGWLTPEWLGILGLGVVILGLVLGFRLGVRHRR
jgi:hypothetical protein